jgi:hypothetical protein
MGVSMQRRIAGVTLVVVGIAMIAGVFALQMFSRAPAFEKMTTDFQQSVTPATVATLRTDVAALRAAGTELQTTGLPALAEQLGIPQDRFATVAEQQFPGLISGAQQLPGIADGFDNLLGTIAAQNKNLQSAAALPTKGFKSQTMPVLILGVGILAILLGLRIGVRSLQWGAVALGAVIIVGVFAVSLPSKSVDADALNKAMKPYFTQQQINTARANMQTVFSTALTLQNKVLPAVAAKTGVPATTLQTRFASQFPNLTRAIVALPDANDKFTALTATFQRNLANYRTVAPFRFAATTWMFATAGLLILLAGAVPLVWLDEEALAAREGRKLHRAA